MKRTWTVESASAYVLSGKRGLKYCSAVDYLRTHGQPVDTTPIPANIKAKKRKFRK